MKMNSLLRPAKASVVLSSINETPLHYHVPASESAGRGATSERSESRHGRDVTIAWLVLDHVNAHDGALVDGVR